MKTLLRFGLAFVVVLIVGAVVIRSADTRRMPLIAADTPPLSIRANSVPLQSGTLTPTVTNETQVLLKVRVIDIQDEKLAEAGIDLLEITNGKEHVRQPSEAPADQVDFSVVSAREGELIARLLKTTGAGKSLAEPSLVTIYGASG